MSTKGIRQAEVWLENERTKKQRMQCVHLNESPPKISDADCFDEIFSNSETLGAAENKFYSSWLKKDSWLSRDADMCVETCEAVSKTLAVEQEVKALNHQLSQIKRRLGPAAEHCSAAYSNILEEMDVMMSGNDHFSCETTPSRAFEEARRACNPFEVLGEGRENGLNRHFMNRSAIKLANIDALLDMSLTHQEDGDNGKFVFADLCAAPGGFSEYIMYRCHEKGKACRAYGMSLTGTNENGHGLEWKLDHMPRLQGWSNANYRVCGGVDGTGDIYKWENVLALHYEIRRDCDLFEQRNFGDPTDQGKAHLVLADGGFDSQRDSECQEALAQKIVVCQAAAAVQLLRRGGTFVMKMFGFQTPVVQTLMKQLFRAFAHMVVLKPISSRPASAERYVVFADYVGAPVGYDGLKWRNSIFLGHCYLTANHEELESDAEVRLRNYLSKLDRDILKLNAKACFAILTYLEGKSQGRGPISIAPYHTTAVDINTYKREWGLE